MKLNSSTFSSGESVLLLAKSLPSCSPPGEPPGTAWNPGTRAASWYYLWKYGCRVNSSGAMENVTQWMYPKNQVFRPFSNLVNSIWYPHPSPLSCMYTNTHIEAVCQLNMEPAQLMQQRCHAKGRVWPLLSSPLLGCCTLKLFHLHPTSPRDPYLLWQTLLMVCCLTVGCCLHKFHLNPAQPAKNAPIHKHFPLITRNTTLPNHCHRHWCLMFRREGEMHVVICYPRWSSANTPHSTRIQNAISSYGMIFCPASLISPFGDQGHNAGLISTLLRLFILYKDQRPYREWRQIP